jgi:molybdopterin converting factor small subunit
MDVEEKIREYSEELKNLLHYEPYNEVAVSYITNKLDKLRKELKDGTS